MHDVDVDMMECIMRCVYVSLGDVKRIFCVVDVLHDPSSME